MEERTMKKIYNSPELRIVNIATTGIIAASVSVKDASEHSTGGTLSGSRRRYSVWDDDEEEDF